MSGTANYRHRRMRIRDVVRQMYAILFRHYFSVTKNWSNGWDIKINDMISDFKQVGITEIIVAIITNRSRESWQVLFYPWEHCNSLLTIRTLWDNKHIHETRSSADADNRLDAFSGQSRSTNMVPFHMLHIVSYCAIVTLSFVVFTIFVFKKFHDLEMGVKGHSRSLRVISFDRLCMVSY